MKETYKFCGRCILCRGVMDEDRIRSCEYPPVFISKEEEDYMKSLDTIDKILEHNKKALKEITELNKKLDNYLC